MPIVRTYICVDCNYQFEVKLRADQWNAPPGDCPRCTVQTRQEFKPVAITGSPMAKAAKHAEEILREDYNVANIDVGKHEGEVPKVRYKENPLPEGWQPQPTNSGWGAHGETWGKAIAAGMQNRREMGSWLDHNKELPDLIEISKRRSGRVW